jgi:hypothetical protein
MNKRKRSPDAAAGYLAIAFGVFGLAAAICPSKINLGERGFGAASAIMALSWGSKEIAAARKWKRAPEGAEAPSSAYITFPKPLLLVVLGVLLLLLAFLIRFAWYKP